MKSVGGIAVALGIAGAAPWGMFSGKSAEKIYAEYVIEIPGPNGKVYFQDLAKELKTTEDISKAKRFDKKDGDIWYAAVQQNLAVNHTPPATRKGVNPPPPPTPQAVKLLGVK